MGIKESNLENEFKKSIVRRKVRLIPRLDIKGSNLIKGIQLEGLRVIGDPNTFAKKYYEEGADELLYMDSVASLYGRNSLKDLIFKASKEVFIPITVGGGIRSVDDANEILRNGADKIAINTAVVKNPKLILDLVDKFGSSTIVLSIEAKQISTNKWEVYIEGGREKTGIDVIEWVHKAIKMGVGEILLTSVDREGTRKGYDINLTKSVTDISIVPVIASGGMGKNNDILKVVFEGNADAVSMADVIHYNRLNLKQIRETIIKNKIITRKISD